VVGIDDFIALRHGVQSSGLSGGSSCTLTVILLATKQIDIFSNGKYLPVLKTTQSPVLYAVPDCQALVVGVQQEHVGLIVVVVDVVVLTLHVVVTQPAVIHSSPGSARGRLKLLVSQSFQSNSFLAGGTVGAFKVGKSREPSAL
jgi:hypothetical protein